MEHRGVSDEDVHATFAPPMTFPESLVQQTSAARAERVVKLSFGPFGAPQSYAV